MADVRDRKSRTKGDKRSEQAAKKYNGLNRDATAGGTNCSEIIAAYEYLSAAAYGAVEASMSFFHLEVLLK